MIAFAAHFYGIGDPEIIENWPSKKIEKWYSEAVKIHNKINKVE